MSHIDQAVVVVLVMVQVAGQVNMIDPDIVGCLDSDRIAVVSENLADLQVSHDNIRLPVDGQTNTSECCGRNLVSHATEKKVVSTREEIDVQLPAFPMIDLFEVTFTLADPEMAPLTTMTAALLDPAAAVSCAKLVTVVVVPPRPPVVLERTASVRLHQQK